MVEQMAAQKAVLTGKSMVVQMARGLAELMGMQRVARWAVLRVVMWVDWRESQRVVSMAVRTGFAKAGQTAVMMDGT
jgi:phosphomannomutase